MTNAADRQGALTTRDGGDPRRGRFAWAVCWTVLISSLFAAVTVLTLTLWATEPGYRETTPLTDLAFLSLGAVIGAGFASQIPRRAPAAGLAQAVLAALALTVCGVAGRRIEPFVGGGVLLAAAAVQWALSRPQAWAQRARQPVNVPAALLTLLAGAAGIAYAVPTSIAAVAAGPSCFLGRCARGDRYAELAATALVIPAIAALVALRVDGWRLPLWSAGIAAITVGASSVALPDATGALGVLGGGACITWGMAFIAVAVHERIRNHSREQ